MPTTTPRRVMQTATRVCATSSISTGAVIAAWAMGVGTSNPLLMLMLFEVAIAVAIVSAVASITARCHLAIGQAFVAGHAVGKAAAAPQPAAPRTTPLRLVD